MAVIELAVFSSAADDATFLAADARMQTDFAYQQRGCRRRLTARADDGDWLVLTWWDSAADADAAAAAGQTDAVATGFWSCVAADTVRRRRFTPLE